MTKSNATERLAAAIRAGTEGTIDSDAQIAALVDWLAEDDTIAPWLVGRLMDLAAHLVAQGRLPERNPIRNDISVELVAALEAARAEPWPARWRRVEAGRMLLGPARPAARPSPVDAPAEKRRILAAALVADLSYSPAAAAALVERAPGEALGLLLAA